MTTTKIDVLLVDDHRIFRDGLRASMSEFDFVSVVGEAVDGYDALEKIKKLSPEVVLMDLNMPKMTGLEVTPIIRQRFPKTKVIALTMHDNKEYISEILRSGAHGYLLKDATPEQLARAIQSVVEGIAFFSPPVSQVVVQQYLENAKPVRHHSDISLTKREQQVLVLLAAGKTSKQIATKLGIGTRTAETFRALLMRKFKVSNTAALMKSANDCGFLQ
jgi:DNA-binding NarL/FixJ family response regulator